MTTPAARQSLAAGLVAAVLGALAGAVVWAVIASVTNYKIGYAAVGVGALTGFLAGKVGGGHPQLPFAAAGIGMLGCLFGDLLISAHELAEYAHVSSFSVMTDHFNAVWEVYKYEFDFLSAVFYGFAGFAAFRLATQHVVMAQQAAAPAYPPPAGPAGEPTGGDPEGAPEVTPPTT